MSVVDDALAALKEERIDRFMLRSRELTRELKSCLNIDAKEENITCHEPFVLNYSDGGLVFKYSFCDLYLIQINGKKINPTKIRSLADLGEEIEQFNKVNKSWFSRFWNKLGELL